MECFKMFYILFNLLFVAIKVSDAINAEFQGIEPRIVVVGGNVTFRWLYTGAKTPTLAEFQVLEDSHHASVLYYGFGADGEPVPFPKVLQKYATGVASVGNVSNNEFAFMLRGVNESSHEKNFSLHIQYEDVTNENFYTKDLLFISVRPKVRLLIKKTNVNVGDRVDMQCEQLLEGRPKATFVWYYNDTLVPGKNEKTFFIDEIELKDAGTYRCAAKNDAGESKSEIKTIIVNEKPNPEDEVRPKVRLLIKKTNVNVGDRVDMQCEQLLEGRPKATFVWYYNDTLVPGKNEKTFFIDEIELKDAGTYRCAAKNDAGESKSEIKTIIVNEKPNPEDEENPTGGKISGSSGGLGGGAIAGIVVAILIVIILVVVFVVMKIKNKSESNKKPVANGDETKSPMVAEPTQRDQVWL